MTSDLSLVVTCEHGGNRVPPSYRSLFRGRARVLGSHRGYDPGALDMARYLSRQLATPLEFATVTRLLVDLNRSVGHPSVFSELSRSIEGGGRADILRRFYHPHRDRVESRIASLVGRGGTVLHVASHSFTPVLKGEVRTADVAWLYDPGRAREKRFCRRWRDELGAIRPDLRLRRNYPYRGSADGLTTHLRSKFTPSRYLGVELEVNSKWFLGDRDDWLRLRRSVAAALALATRSSRL